MPKPQNQANNDNVNRDIRIPKFVWYVIMAFVIGLIAFDLNTKNHLKQQQEDLLTQQNVAQGKLYKAKDSEHQVTYVVSPKGQLSQNGLGLIKTANEMFTLGTTFTSQKQYNQHIQTMKKYIWDSSVFSQNSFFGPHTKDYFAYRFPILSQTQEVDTYQIDEKHYLSIIRFITYTNSHDLQYTDQLKNTYQAFIFTGTNNRILQISPVDGFYSPSGFQQTQ